MFDIVLAFCLLLSSAPLFLCFPLQKTQDVMLPKFIILAVKRCYFQLFIILRYYCIPYSCLYASGCFDVLQQPLSCQYYVCMYYVVDIVFLRPMYVVRNRCLQTFMFSSSLYVFCSCSCLHFPVLLYLDIQLPRISIFYPCIVIL